MNDTKFDYTIHYLRGFAMINIVLFHAFLGGYIVYVNDAQRQLAHNILFTLFTLSTSYLLFISGFLFYKLNQGINVTEFYKKKLSFIVCPYVITSLSLVLISHARHILKGEFCSYVATPQSFGQLAQYIIDGRVSVQFWFMPTICIIFLVCPLMCFINVNSLKRVLYICIFFPLLFDRVGLDFFSYKGLLTSVYTILDCFGVFLAGSLYFLEKDRVDMFIKNNIKLIVCGCLLASVLIFTDANMGIPRGRNLYVVQKYLILSCMLYLFNFCSVNKYITKFFSIFATYSFSIYFWHIFVIYFICAKFYIWVLDVVFASLLVKMLLFGIVSLVVSLLFCMLLKKITGKYSRYIIGS